MNKLVKMIHHEILFAHLCNMQAETEQRPHKVSFYVEKEHAQEVIKSLSDRFEKRRV